MKAAGYNREGTVRTIRRKRKAAAVFFLWVFLILAQFGSIFATPNEIIRGGRGSVRFSPARKVLGEVVYETAVPIDASPASSPSNDHFKEYSLINGDGNALNYGEDKRKIHTGPNPLHN